MENTLTYDMADEYYFAIDAINISTLNRMAKSPQHCRHYKQNPPKTTDSMRFGRLVHTLVLEPQNFDLAFAVAPEGINRRTKAGKKEWEEFEIKSYGRQVVKVEEWRDAAMVAHAVLKHPGAKRLLGQEGHAEVTMTAMYPGFNVKCKGRADFIRDDTMMVDLKTSTDASPEGFARSIYRYGYHRQAAFYVDLYELITGNKPKGFAFVVVETTAPYAVATYEIDERSIELGRFEYKQYLARYLDCMDSDHWPSYDEAVITLSLPEWAFIQ